MPTKVEIYADAAGEWRWRIKDSGNHKILADSGEGYTERNDAYEALDRVRAGLLRLDAEPEG